MGKRSARPSAKRPAGRLGRRKPGQEAASSTSDISDVIELESEESFPASDAPSWTITRVGHPARDKRKH